MKTNILEAPVLEMLDEFKKIVLHQEVDFFIIGAIARDIRLAYNPELKAIRSTKDVDIALMIADESQFYKVKDALLATGNIIGRRSKSC